MMTKHRVFHNRLSRANRLEEIPKVRLHLVPGNTAIADSFKCRLLAGNRIVLLVPLLEIGLTHALGKTRCVIAGREVHAGLWDIGGAKFG